MAYNIWKFYDGYNHDDFFMGISIEFTYLLIFTLPRTMKIILIPLGNIYMFIKNIIIITKDRVIKVFYMFWKKSFLPNNLLIQNESMQNYAEIEPARNLQVLSEKFAIAVQ